MDSDVIQMQILKSTMTNLCKKTRGKDTKTDKR